MSGTIRKISAIEILDSRGNPTLETTVLLDSGISASASVPSGASTGAFEAFELRDHDPLRYEGEGVRTAIHNVNTELNELLQGFDVIDQRNIDESMIKMDGTENKHRLGANAILGVSLAVARAAALSEQMPLYQYLRSLVDFQNQPFEFPVPLINLVNGGKHASSNLNLQEFWVIPYAESIFSERVRQGSEVFHVLGEILKARGMSTDLGNEGGYAPNFGTHAQVFELLLEAIAKAGFSSSLIALGYDAGATVFFDRDQGVYRLALEDTDYTSDEFIEYHMQLAKRFPIKALEDPLAEEDWDGWQRMTAQYAERFNGTTVIGDDLFVTNSSRLRKGIDLGVANAILIKPNQIGTLIETLDCIMLAKKSGYATAISHRSGETTDSFIADLAVAVNAEYIKTGSTARGERTVKYNRLIEIEQELYGTQKT